MFINIIVVFVGTVSFVKNRFYFYINKFLTKKSNISAIFKNFVNKNQK